MKKPFLILTILLFFASCGTSQKEVSEAKQKLLQNTETPPVTQNQDPEIIPDEGVEEDDTKSNIQIIALDDFGLISFDDISESSLTTGEVKISGRANPSVEKIQVEFSNPISNYPDDDYTLQTFEKGDSEFRYIAASRHQVLDFGENNYIFTAYAGDTVSKTKVVLHVEDTAEEVTGSEQQLIGFEDNTVLVDLPTSSKYGEPMRLGESSFTYTQIKGLEVTKEIFEVPTCETVTEFLQGRISSWFYWNTCRDIVKEKGMKFNVVRLDGESYIYERHYIDFVHGFYGTYELEKGTGVTSENIAEKNSDLKEQEFPSLEVVDDLMKDIVNS